MKIYNVILFLLLLFLISCANKKSLKSQIVNKDGLDILYGEINQEQLFYDFPEWKSNYDAYKVDQKTLDSLKSITTKDVTIEIFLGTWCGDSRREVPHFLKTIDESGLSKQVQLKLYAVDRKKNMENGLSSQKKIERVATFIVLKNSTELGRIVETPIKRIEQDLLTILTNL